MGGKAILCGCRRPLSLSPSFHLGFSCIRFFFFQALGNLAEVFRRMEEHDKALPLFQQAIALHQAAVAAKGGEARVGPMEAMGASVRPCRHGVDGLMRLAGCHCCVG